LFNQGSSSFKRYSDHDLDVIADFLEQNAERLRAETEKIDREQAMAAVRIGEG
jgi:hypothetical protein